MLIRFDPAPIPHVWDNIIGTTAECTIKTTNNTKAFVIWVMHIKGAFLSTLGINNLLPRWTYGWLRYNTVLRQTILKWLLKHNHPSSPSYFPRLWYGTDMGVSSFLRCCLLVCMVVMLTAYELKNAASLLSSRHVHKHKTPKPKPPHTKPTHHPHKHSHSHTHKHHTKPTHRPTCRPVDCVVTSWSLWGPCSVPCGTSGIQERTRQVCVHQGATGSHT